MAVWCLCGVLSSFLGLSPVCSYVFVFRENVCGGGWQLSVLLFVRCVLLHLPLSLWLLFVGISFVLDGVIIDVVDLLPCMHP